MNLKNCSRCKRIFSTSSDTTVCQNCIKRDEEEFKKVREYLRENRGADINTVSEETGVTTKVITKYLKEGRLEVSEGISSFLRCEKCGVSIRTGRYCNECSRKISRSLKRIIPNLSETEKENAKMHTRRY